MAGIVTLIVIGLVLVHLAGVLHSHGRNRRRGANFGWSLRRGWWGSVRVFGGTYYKHI